MHVLPHILDASYLPINYNDRENQSKDLKYCSIDLNSHISLMNKISSKLDRNKRIFCF